MDIKGVSIDSRTIRQGELFFALRGDRFDGHDFVAEAIRKGASGAIVERSVLEARYGDWSGLRNVIPVEDTLLSLQELSMMHRKKFPVPLVAITGSNGKTTTKEMLAAVLALRGPVLKTEGNLNNHIGVPLMLFRLAPEHRSAIIEMGMSGPGEIESLTRLAMPDVGVITNIGPAHLQFLGSTEAVARAKGELLEGMRTDGTAVLNADDPFFDQLRSRFSGRTLSFGIERPADVRATGIAQQREGSRFLLSAPGGSVPVWLGAVGIHNVANALAAAAAAVALDTPLETVRQGLEAFRPGAMRTELRVLKERTVLLDCYNANPASMLAALQTLAATAGGRRTVAVLGDMLELGGEEEEAHRGTGQAVARLQTGLLIAVGRLGRHIAEGARRAGMEPDRVRDVATTVQAAELLHRLTRPGDIVLIKGSRGMKMESVLEGF